MKRFRGGFHARVNQTALIRSLAFQAPFGTRDDHLRKLESGLDAAIDLALDGGLARDDIAKVLRARAVWLEGGRR